MLIKCYFGGGNPFTSEQLGRYFLFHYSGAYKVTHLFLSIYFVEHQWDDLRTPAWRGYNAIIYYLPPHECLAEKFWFKFLCYLNFPNFFFWRHSICAFNKPSWEFFLWSSLCFVEKQCKKRNRNSWHCLCVGHVPVKPLLIGKKGPKASEGGLKMGVVKQPN